MFNKLKEIFNVKSELDECKDQLKATQQKVELLEKKVSDCEAVLLDHHKTIAMIAVIQSNMLAEFERTLTSGAKVSKKMKVHVSSSKDDEFIN